MAWFWLPGGQMLSVKGPDAIRMYLCIVDRTAFLALANGAEVGVRSTAHSTQFSDWAAAGIAARLNDFAIGFIEISTDKPLPGPATSIRLLVWP
jgi:hypothetical protein